MAVLTTNVAANLVPPTNVIATLFHKKVSYKQAALIAAILALFAQPWNALASAYELIYNVSVSYTHLNVIAYRSQYGSVNPAAIVGAGIVATAVSTAVAVAFCKGMEWIKKK